MLVRPSKGIVSLNSQQVLHFRALPVPLSVQVYVEGVFSFFLASWASSFFMIFSVPFYVDFGSISESNLEQKSSQNRIRS